MDLVLHIAKSQFKKFFAPIKKNIAITCSHYL